jgi:hypothetical protein
VLPGVGVLYDYFRAADDDAAVKLMDDLPGGPVAAAADGLVDAVDMKGIEPTVTLGRLVAHIQGIEWQAGLVGLEELWGDEDSPFVMSVDDATRDCLASVSDAQMPGLAAWWGGIEELARWGPVPAGQMLPFLTGIVGLARRARAAGEHLYCWCCL